MTDLSSRLLDMTSYSPSPAGMSWRRTRFRFWRKGGWFLGARAL